MDLSGSSERGRVDFGHLPLVEAPRVNIRVFATRGQIGREGMREMKKERERERSRKRERKRERVMEKERWREREREREK